MNRSWISWPARKAREDLIADLTDRELEIFTLIGQGCDRREIARRLGISTSTIGTYRDRIKTKLNMKTSGELVKFAVEWSGKHQLISRYPHLPV